MKHFIYSVLLVLLTVPAFAQFTDTTQLSQFIRDTITDRRPDKISAAQLQKGLLGILQFLPLSTPLNASQVGYGSSNNTLTGKSIFTFNDATNTLQVPGLQVTGNFTTNSAYLANNMIEPTFYWASTNPGHTSGNEINTSHNFMQNTIIGGGSWNSGNTMFRFGWDADQNYSGKDTVTIVGYPFVANVMALTDMNYKSPYGNFKVNGGIAGFGSILNINGNPYIDNYADFVSYGTFHPYLGDRDTVINRFGLYVGDLNADNNANVYIKNSYPIYAAGANDLSYFAGKLVVGGPNPPVDNGSKLQVNGSIFQDGGVFHKNYYTDLGHASLNIGSGFELYGINHASGGYSLYLSGGLSGNFDSGWDFIIGSNTDPLMVFDDHSITTNQPLNVTNGLTLTEQSSYAVSPYVGFQYVSVDGWSWAVVNSAGTPNLVVGSNGNVLVGTTTDYGATLQDAGSLSLAVKVSAASTLSLDATATHWVFSGSTAPVWTLPAVAGHTGWTYFIKNRGSATVTLNSNAGGNDLYDTLPIATLSITAGSTLRLINDGTFWLVE